MSRVLTAQMCEPLNLLDFIIFLDYTLNIFRGSSMVEQLAVNQWVAGSNPALGVFT